MSRLGSKEATVAELKGVHRQSSSNASQGTTVAAQALPLSFSLRHNELADPTIQEKMVLKVSLLHGWTAPPLSAFAYWLVDRNFRRAGGSVFA